MVRDTTASTPVPPSRLRLSSPQRVRAALARLLDRIWIAHYQHRQIEADMRQARAVAHIDRTQHCGLEFI